MKIRGKDKKHIIRDQNLPCDFPGCGRHFQTPQALFAHRRMIHNLRDKAVPEPGAQVKKVSAEDLESEVRVLKLQEAKRELEAKLPPSARPEDIMSRLGLGNLTGEAQTIAQKRVLGIMDQGQAPNWLSQLLSSPGGIKTAIDGLRGVLDIHPKNDGSSGLGVLKELGIDLKSLLEHSQATKADSSFKVGGISLDGVRLTPDVLSSLIQFKQAEDSLTYQKSKDESFRDGMQQLIKLVTDSGILNRIGGGIVNGLKRGAGRDISQEILPGSEPGEQIIICPRCGTENKLPADIGPGTTFKCIGPGCEQSWITEQARQPQRQAKKKQVKVEAPIAEETACPGCGQLVNIDGRNIGETVKCPACGDELVVNSETLAAPAQDLSEAEKLSKSFLNKGV